MATRIENEVAQLLKDVRINFIEDKPILVKFAHQHKTEVREIDIFGTLGEPGVYHLLLPSFFTREAEKLLNAPSLNELCSDYRQDFEVVSDLGINTEFDAKLVIAGGGSQLLDRRQKALAKVGRAYLVHNPYGILRKVLHSGFCGRFRKDMGDLAKNAWAFDNMVTIGGESRDGQPENDFLLEQLNNAYYDLIREDWANLPSSVDRNRISLYIAHVKGPEHGSYIGVQKIR